ncbi:MAG: pyruvate formate-lyase-activating protein [Fibrobacterales bacterium]
MAHTGYIHSVETFGTLDGPGIRYVLFLQGCHLRCLYCHNPDSQEMKTGSLLTTESAFNEIIKYKSFYTNGGVTFTGGEPLLQSSFIIELATMLKEAGIKTALDTSGSLWGNRVREALNAVDLVLLDCKGYSSEHFTTMTEVNKGYYFFETLDHLEEIGKKSWVRFVLVPGYTDDLKAIEELAQRLMYYAYIEYVEILPFHNLGKEKWEQIGRSWPLEECPLPTQELMQQVQEIFISKGLRLK